MDKPYRVLNVFMVLDRGGAETFVMNIFRHIDRSRVQFDFLVHGDTIGAYEEEIRALGGRIYRLPTMGLRSLPTYLKAVDRFLQEHGKEYKVIHSHASELGCFIFQKAKKYGIPFRVCHAHSAPKGMNVKTPVRFLFKKYMLRFTNVGFACGDEAGRWQFGKAQPFRVINNGIPTAKYAFDVQTREMVRSRYGIRENQLVVGHIGRFETPKNHAFLIDVFEQVVAQRNDAVLMLIGIGSLQDSIRQRVKEKHLEDHVIFLNAQSDVTPFLQAMDVFVFPSLFEGLGIALVEAQAAGLSCVAADMVPKAANVTDLVTNLSLTESAQTWANSLCAADVAYDRSGCADKVAEAGYDIVSSAISLQTFYEECYAKEQE